MSRMSLRLRLPLLALLLAVAGSAFAQSSPEAALNEAATAIEKKQFLAAEKVVEPLAKAKKPHPYALSLLSQIRAAQHRLDEAIKLAERATKIDSSQARYFTQLGNVYYRKMGDTYGIERSIAASDTRKAFEKALKLSPNDPGALGGLANFYGSATDEEGGSVTKSAEFATRLKPLDPAQAEMVFGMLAMRRQDREGALRHYEASAEYKADNPIAYFSAGMALLQLGRKEDARRRFETALKVDPSYSPARVAIQTLDNPPPTPPAPAKK